MAGYITTKTPSQDAQGRWWEQLSPTQTLSGLAPLLPRDISIATSQQQTKKKKQKKKSKCHGDVKLHHLKHKWRAQGLSEGTIQAFVQNRKQYRQQRMELRPCNDNRIEVDTTTVKRKRDRSSQASMHSSAKSLNQLSLSPRCRKRPRTMIEKAPSLADILCNVTELDVKLQKFSKYLKMPRYLLLRSLQLQLNCRLKQEDEQNYIIRQLQLIDGQFCVDRIRYLYQSYLDLGSSAHIWPVSGIYD